MRHAARHACVHDAVVWPQLAAMALAPFAALSVPLATCTDSSGSWQEGLASTLRAWREGAKDKAYSESFNK